MKYLKNFESINERKVNNGYKEIKESYDEAKEIWDEASEEERRKMLKKAIPSMSDNNLN